jgi:hypothetical protein
VGSCAGGATEYSGTAVENHQYFFLIIHSQLPYLSLHS